MYVAKVPNRGSPPAILLRESYREDGKVKNRTLSNLSHWPQEKVDALSAVLKGLPPKHSIEDSFSIIRSLPHGHVAAVLGMIKNLGLDSLIVRGLWLACRMSYPRCCVQINVEPAKTEFAESDRSAIQRKSLRAKRTNSMRSIATIQVPTAVHT